MLLTMPAAPCSLANTVSAALPLLETLPGTGKTTDKELSSVSRVLVFLPKV